MTSKYDRRLDHCTRHGYRGLTRYFYCVPCRIAALENRIEELEETVGLLEGENDLMKSEALLKRDQKMTTPGNKKWEELAEKSRALQPKTVLELLRQALELNGYDGLYNDECGCFLADLVPCDGCFCDCKPGRTTNEDGFMIVGEREK